MIDQRTVVLLIRHAHTDAVGQRLVSRLPGVPLSARGRSEVARLREMLRPQRLAAIYASPLERTTQTAEALAIGRDLPLQRCDDLIEVDFGEWTGRTFAELNQNPAWRRFNEQRGSAPVPGGETAADVQTRIVTGLERLRVRHPGETIAAVSHADVIRAALLHYIGAPLDDWQQVEIEPASVSAVALAPERAEVLFINRRPSLT